jgi:poly(3-hydroxybutyrate) depolymerase
MTLISMGCAHNLPWYRTGPKMIHKQFSGAEGRGFDYWLLTQKEPGPEKIPLVVVFHGAGQNGQTYLAVWNDEAVKRRYMILAPNFYYSGDRAIVSVDDLNKLLKRVLEKYSVDRERIYLAGISAGGIVARRMYADAPQNWAGMVLVATPYDEKWMDKLDGKKCPPVLCVHGGHDEQIDYAEAVKSAELMRNLGFNVTLLDWPEGKHEHRPEWNAAIFDWMERKS